MKPRSISLLKITPYILLLYTSLLPVVKTAEATVDLRSAQIHNPSEDIDLISFLNFRAQKHDEVFTQALEILETLNSSSSCNKFAANKLVTSCRSIGRNPETPIDPDTYLALEHVRSLYAARLAICEISGAGISIPSQCKPVNVSPPTQKGLFGRYTKSKMTDGDSDPIPQTVLEPCLRSLESRPQWWTSYSNSRQNAVIICQASRSEIDKEDILETYNTILQSSVKLSEGLHEALKTAAEESVKSKTFMQTLDLLRKEAVQDIEKSTSSLVSRLSGLIETHLESMSEIVSSALKRLNLGVSGLEEDIQESSRSADALRHMLQYIHDETRLRNEQLALTQRQTSETQNELAASLESKLKSITQNDIKELTQSVGRLDNSLEWLYARILQISQQEAGVSERLQDIGSSLVEFQLRVDHLEKAQRRQYEIAIAQAQTQEDLQSGMRIFKGILDETTSTAAALYTTINDTTSIYRDNPSLSGLFWSSWNQTLSRLRWALIGTIIIVMFFTSIFISLLFIWFITARRQIVL